jgi:hypothetical protein
MKSANSPGLLLATLCFAAMLLAGCGRLMAPQSPIVGKWGTVDRSYVVEFLPSGNCAVTYHLNARIAGHATGDYTVDKDAITTHWHGAAGPPIGGGSNVTAVWHYSLDGDNLTLSYSSIPLTLHRMR